MEYTYYVTLMRGGRREGGVFVESSLVGIIILQYYIGGWVHTYIPSHLASVSCLSLRVFVWWVPTKECS